MADPHRAHATDIDLSAYLDAELDAVERLRVECHLVACPLCSARLADFSALSADFAQLRHESLGVNLEGVIVGRLSAAVPSRLQAPSPGWRSRLPLGFGVAASLALGIAMGAILFSGGALLPRVTAMSVFDPIPPGSLCPDPGYCNANGPLLLGAMR